METGVRKWRSRPAKFTAAGQEEDAEMPCGHLGSGNFTAEVRCGLHSSPGKIQALHSQSSLEKLSLRASTAVKGLHKEYTLETWFGAVHADFFKNISQWLLKKKKKKQTPQKKFSNSYQTISPHPGILHTWPPASPSLIFF